MYGQFSTTQIFFWDFSVFFLERVIDFLSIPVLNVFIRFFLEFLWIFEKTVFLIGSVPLCFIPAGRLAARGTHQRGATSVSVAGVGGIARITLQPLHGSSAWVGIMHAYAVPVSVI